MTKKVKIYDCFLFYNELELLEIRLNILDKYVDYFVLLEATKTFNNNPKEMYYEKNKHLFEKFSKKIIHIKLDNHPEFTNAWDYEKHQRNSLILGLEKVQLEDVIMLSDVDEIPNPYLIEKVKFELGIKVFKLPTFYYYLNVLTNDVAMCTRIFFAEEIKKRSMSEIRVAGDKLYTKKTGWHFSFLGDEKFIKNKIENFSHQEFNNDLVKDNISLNIENGKDIFNREGFKTKYVKMGSNYPNYIMKNLKKYQHLIKQP